MPSLLIDCFPYGNYVAWISNQRALPYLYPPSFRVVGLKVVIPNLFPCMIIDVLDDINSNGTIYINVFVTGIVAPSGHQSSLESQWDSTSLLVKPSTGGGFFQLDTHCFPDAVENKGATFPSTAMETSAMTCFLASLMVTLAPPL